MDATGNLDDEDLAKIVADAEQVSEDGDTDANLDRVPTASDVMNVVSLFR